MMKLEQEDLLEHYNSVIIDPSMAHDIRGDYRAH